MRRVTVISEGPLTRHVRKPRNAFKVGDVVRVKYQDGHTVLLTILQEKYGNTCSKCCLGGVDNKCLGYIDSDNECCLAGAYNYFKSIDDIMENI